MMERCATTYQRLTPKHGAGSDLPCSTKTTHHAKKLTRDARSFLLTYVQTRALANSKVRTLRRLALSLALALTALALAIALALTDLALALALLETICTDGCATVAPDVGLVHAVPCPADLAHELTVVLGRGPPVVHRPGHCKWIFNSPSV